MDDEKIKQWLKQRLDIVRYNHSEEVGKRAGLLAKIYGEDIDKARIAGLLHDCCHGLKKDSQLKIIESRGILLDIFTKSQPQLYHAIAGSIVVCDELSISDAGVIAAIRYHTTGRAGMPRLEQIVYLADYTSLDRNYSGVIKNRALCEQSLEKCMLKSLSETLRMLVKTKAPIVKDAWEAYNYFWELTEGNNKSI